MTILLAVRISEHADVRRRVPVVPIDKYWRNFLTLERELVFGQFRHRSRLLEKETVDPFKNVTHPIEEFQIREFIGQKFNRILGVVGLNSRDGTLLCSYLHMVAGNLFLLFGDL